MTQYQKEKIAIWLVLVAFSGLAWAALFAVVRLIVAAL